MTMPMIPGPRSSGSCAGPSGPHKEWRSIPCVASLSHPRLQRGTSAKAMQYENVTARCIRVARKIVRTDGLHQKTDTGTVASQTSTNRGLPLTTPACAWQFPCYGGLFQHQSSSHHRTPAGHVSPKMAMAPDVRITMLHASINYTHPLPSGAN